MATMFRWLPAAALIALATGAASAADPQPLAPQPAASALKDGLAVETYLSRFDHVDQLAAYAKANPGKPGAPLPNLDYEWQGGNVLGTTSDDFVGARITGLILLDKPGPYEFQVTSNDGVRVTLGGAQVFEDPAPHPDSTSEPLPVTIKTPGYYPIDVLYYEKKGTATLKLAWRPPGATGFAPVPPSAFKHLP